MQEYDKSIENVLTTQTTRKTDLQISAFHISQNLRYLFGMFIYTKTIETKKKRGTNPLVKVRECSTESKTFGLKQKK